MENLKHTKGEWTINPVIKKNEFGVNEKGIDALEARATNICSVFYNDKLESQIEAEATANDLLEALIEMYKSCKPQKFGVDLLETDLTSVGSITMPSEQAVLKMCNAINKATK